MSARIVHVVQSPRPGPDCTAVSLAGLFSEGRARGLSVEAVAEKEPAQSQAGEPAAGAAFSTKNGLVLKGIDFVHIHGWGYRLAHAAAAAAKSAGVRYVITPGGSIRGGEREPRTLRAKLSLWRTRKLVRGAAFLAAVNAFEEQLLRDAKVHDSVRVLPYGAVFDDLAERAMVMPPGQPERLLLVMGDVGPRSGCVALLKALAEIGASANPWRVTLAGDCTTEWRKALQAAVRRKGAEDRVGWAEADTVAQQMDLLSKADLFVCPSAYVRPPVAVVQAIAAGVPVLCTRQTAPGELDVPCCGPGREELRAALHKLLQDSDGDRLSAAGALKARAAAQLDWGVLAGRYLQMYGLV